MGSSKGEISVAWNRVGVIPIKKGRTMQKIKLKKAKGMEKKGHIIALWLVILATGEEFHNLAICS